MNVLADGKERLLELSWRGKCQCFLIVFPSDGFQICYWKGKTLIIKKAILQLNEKIVQNPGEQKCDLEGGLHLLF